MYHMVCRVCGIAILMSASSASASAAGIGVVVDVVNEGYRTPPGASELIARPTDEVVEGEGLRTGVESAIHVQFVDGSELSVEAESEILLSDYVFEPASGAADADIQLTEGLFHFNSNGVEDSGIALHTPVATIGIRGTEFVVSVAADVTVVDILDGAIEITPRGGGKAIICEGGQSALVAAADADAMCGDLGSFSTAAGVPPEQASLGRLGEGHGGFSGNRPDGPGNGSSGGGNSGGGDPGGGDPGGGGPGGGDPGGGDPGGGGPGGGKTNHSGLGDGSNPGKGHGNGNQGGNSGGNGGQNNPGGGRK